MNMGDRCEAQVGDPPKWVDAVYRGCTTNSIIVFVDVLDDNGKPINLGLSSDLVRNLEDACHT